MEVIIRDTAECTGAIAADAVAALFRSRPDAVLGLATGSSPVAIYNELSRRVAAGELSLARGRGFTLDEYVGLPNDHRRAE